MSPSAGDRAQDAGDALQHAIADQVAVFVVDLLEAVAVDQQQAAGRRSAPLRRRSAQMLGEAAAVVQAGEFVGADQFFGLVEAVRGGAQRIQRGLQVLVAAAQAADQALLVQHDAHDRAAQEMRDQARVAIDQALGTPHGAVRPARHRLAAMASALRAWSPISRPSSPKNSRGAQALGDEVVAEVEIDRACAITYMVVPRSPRRNRFSPASTRRMRPTAANSAYSRGGQCGGRRVRHSRLDVGWIAGGGCDAAISRFIHTSGTVTSGQDSTHLHVTYAIGQVSSRPVPVCGGSCRPRAESRLRPRCGPATGFMTALRSGRAARLRSSELLFLGRALQRRRSRTGRPGWSG